MRGGRRGGSMLVSVLWVLFAIGIVLAVLQVTGVYTVEDSLEFAKDKSKEYSECIPSGECGIASIFDDIKEIFGKDPVDIIDGGSSSKSSKGEGNTKGESNSEEKEDSIEVPERGESFDDLQIDSDTRGYRGPEKGEPYVNKAGMVHKEAAMEMLEELQTVSDKEDEEKDVGYSRREWKHWVGDSERPCWSTRSEILHRDAVPGSVKYVNKSKEPTDDYSEACAIGIPKEDKGKVVIVTEGSGEWIDPYSGNKITDPRTIDIDHVLPLSNAARQGGQEWSAEKKEQFANDPDNLLATSAKENRSKGDKGPGKYMPPLKSYHCQYAKTYTSLSYKYELTITESDFEVLNKAIQACRH